MVQQDEWVVCRVFQKSAGGKKYPTSSSSNAVGHSSRGGGGGGGAPVNINNPYNINLEIGGPNSVMQHLHMQSQMMQQAAADAAQFPISSRNHYMMTNPEMAEISRVFRGGGGGGGGFPIQPQLNYPGGAAAAGGGCFTISGLNLNLGGGGGGGRGGGGASASQLPIFRPQHQPGGVNLNLQDAAASSSMYTTGTNALATEIPYGADQVNNGNANHMAASGNRYMANMDQCLDMDSYGWPPY